MGKQFEYKYASPTEEERREIEFIRKQYMRNDKQETKLDRLRKLNKKVQMIPSTIALILGVIGTLVFGLGLTMILEWNLIVWGVVVAGIGCLPIGFAYYIYNKIYKKLKEKHSEEILNLSKELLNENE